MPKDVRLWAVCEGDSLLEVSPSRLNLEARIESWIKLDPKILRPDLLVIGNQVETDYGGYIDLLCMDPEGNLVVVELKRDKTPREITAQALDYASWVKDLSTEQIDNIANQYLGDTGPLATAFKRRFGEELPDVINESHSMLVVASEIDPSSERIINYLSQEHGVSINAVTFQFFRDKSGTEFLARTFLVAPDEVQQRARSKGHSKRTIPTSEQIQANAEEHGVGELYEMIATELVQYAVIARRKSSATMVGEMSDGSLKALLAFLPDKSSADMGLRFQLYTDRLAEYCGLRSDDIIDLLPEGHEPYSYYANAPADLTGRAGFFRTNQDISRFLRGVTGSPQMKLHLRRRSELSPGEKSALTKRAKTAAGYRGSPSQGL